ncbi:TerB family tellurite resistance protein [Zhongshania sp. BJYM1]|uniref:tellurite resistance TerB family protein n=1 Tax=Zhongshania aquatica TaxID=2965069 RepID=UPI0022B52196|nr:TerB family tellurite resistance protein [Marortus sp. BJYM1]
MFEKLKQLFSVEENTEKNIMSLELAAAALLIEVSKSDFQQDPGEIDKIRELLVRCFSVSLADIEDFMATASAINKDSTSLYPFTRYINDNCNNIEKYELIAALWEVAIEDGRIDKYEDHLIRKISNLIYLPHTEFIRAKLTTTGKTESNNS